MRGTRRRLLAGLVVLAPGLLLFGNREARASIAFTGTSAAHGIYTTTSAPNVLPLGLQGDGGDVTAQATANSLQDSTGFAASPDSGSASRTGAGTVAGSLPAGTVPANPQVAFSSYPTTPSASAGAGAISLTAMSTADSSKATATTGGSASALSQPSASSSVTASDAVSGTGVDSDAETTVDGVSIAGVLAISHVHAVAHASRDSGGHLQRASTLEVGPATVAGQPVTIDGGGVHAAGGAVPVPDSALTSELAQQGVSVTVTPEQDTPDGVVASGVQVMVTQTPPAGGTVTTTYLLGVASATATASGAANTRPIAIGIPPTVGSASPSPADAGSGPPTKPVTRRGGAAPVRRPTTAPATAPAAAAAPPVGTTAVPTASSPAPAAADPASNSAAVAAGQAPPIAPAAAAAPAAGPVATVPVATVLVARQGQLAGSLNLLDLYLVLAAAALLTLGAGSLMRYMGVRSLWSS